MTSSKSLTQIHQQTLDIFCRLNNRHHTTHRTIDKVAAIHNRYSDNIAIFFGAMSADYLTLWQWEQPIPAGIYAQNWTGNLPRIPMTDADKEMIRVARRLHCSQWHIIADMEDRAQTEEARRILHDLRRDKCVQEKNSCDFNLN